MFTAAEIAEMMAEGFAIEAAALSELAWEEGS